MGGSFYLVIVGPNDRPVFELEFGTHTREKPVDKEDQRHLHQFIIHSALDQVDAAVWTTNATNLKVVDRFNEWYISAYVTGTATRFMLMHDQKQDDSIKAFFQELQELYIKASLNPFYTPGQPITSQTFANKVATMARRLE
eukprot:TRINITY_DN11896_c0_g2_i1.p1 TRINITY_DN11896_c0_g2~~TRINITY_DN11896_c0_g2_i1.p1  ORF type:complete len:141 (+),score=34.25 TRINITY_DN11896_c0_g2_i1:76-498(+)